MVNLDQGNERTILYCGRTYTVRPGERNNVHRKQFWHVMVDGETLAQSCISLGKAQSVIHKHAVDTGAYAATYHATGKAPLCRLSR